MGLDKLTLKMNEKCERQTRRNTIKNPNGKKKKKQFSSSLPGKVKIASPIQGEPVIN